ncbi:hypothetical protein DY245_15395 [Streptomyces inhibens]|uniref:Uncharacterized protein n=1 Tax=Streptomyces inhibens TaxID=2293571 RepID=A0A371Q464_STRIH|nr:hypothetical protein DY245_15395 [Streptomyces inhibens]
MLCNSISWGRKLIASKFATESKTAAGYLDVAANAHGEEKGYLAYQALQRVERDRPRLVEIGPGGGSAVTFLASRLAAGGHGHRNVNLTLVEVPGVVSTSLHQAMAEFGKVGTCDLVTGFAQDIGTLVTDPVDVISASALMHEVYSYGGGYAGLHSMIRTIPIVLREGGLFAYRDVYAVDGGSLHDRAVQTYGAKSWVQFLRMFLPQYLREGTHPYHGEHDEVIVRQDSRIIPVDEIANGTHVFISAPIGIFREVQRHYITLRDHVWRSGVLGFVPVLDGQLASDWIDAKTGHKRVHYRLTDTDWLPISQKTMMLALSERYADHYTVDGDIFDQCTDIALSQFLASAEVCEGECQEVWEHWNTREGRETYAYMTVDTLLATFAVSSTESNQDNRTVLMPVQVEDVVQRDRSYYNRYLRRALPNPLRDAKQLVLFSNIPLTDSDALQSAMHSVQQWCSRANLARMYSAVNTGG